MRHLRYSSVPRSHAERDEVSEREIGVERQVRLLSEIDTGGVALSIRR